MLDFRVRGEYHFDRRSLNRGFKKNNKDPLKKSGAFIMRNAKQSIRRTKKKSSSPGNPPKSHAPGDPLKLILFDVQPTKSRVIVGPVKLSHTTASLPVPGLLEKGGQVPRQIRVKQEKKKRKAITSIQKKAFLKLKKEGRLKNRSRERQQRRTVTANYEKRPFMVPALLKARQKLPLNWQGSIVE